MKRWISRAIGAVVTIALLGAALWLVPVAVSAYRMSEADTAVAEGRIDYAIEMLLPELERSPKDSGLRIRLINLYIEQGNFGRAEYLLVHGMREQGGQTELYGMLCDVYVRQDKLLDAVELLNNLPNPHVKAELDERRPAPPALTPPPGTYFTTLSLEIERLAGQSYYITLDGDIPSTAKDIYSEPIQLPKGATSVKAVAVGEDGLVSDWAEGTYTLDDIRENVTFAEPVIEACARELLGAAEGEITSGMLQEITELEIAESHDYRTLDDLAWFSNLTRLSLTGGESHTDIKALAGLTQLADLTLRGMGLDSMDMETIGVMTGLNRLDLTNNQIATLGNLGGLTGLTELILSENNITDIEPLAGLLELTVLELRQNGIGETAALSELTKLVRLDMQSNRVRDLQGLSRMKSLKSLNLSYNSIALLEPLAGLTALTGLSLSHNKDLFSVDIPAEEETPEEEDGEEENHEEEEEQPVNNSLKPLGSLVNLKTLLLDACGIEDISLLAPLVKLERLSLNDNRLESLEGVQEMVEMNELSADRNFIKSLIPLQAMSKLTVLHIEYNGLPSLKAIKELPSIRVIYAFGNQLTDTVAFTAPNVTVYKG